MRRRGAAAAWATLAVWGVATAASAGAWPQEKGHGLLILKAEDEQADDGYSPGRDRVAIPHLRDDYLTLYGEYGLTSSLTLQGKASYTDGEDQFVKYSGRGPIELGLKWTAFQRGRTVVSFYAGAIANGVGRNAEYARPDQGATDAEIRALLGQSWKWRGHEAFADVELARLFRGGGLADETRLDATAGAWLTPKWLVLVQSYAGEAKGQTYDSQWLKLEGGVVRQFGRWSLQAGWRGVVWGKETPISSGPVLGVWRRF